MTKEDWIKLAMNVSITMLALTIVTQPMVSNAFPSSIHVTRADTIPGRLTIPQSRLLVEVG